MPPICKKCHAAAVEVRIPASNLAFCSKCFLEFFVKRVRETVQKYRMFGEEDEVGVAVSGGKDSATLLQSLREAFPSLRIIALHVNLGIDGYSDHCQKKVEELVKKVGVELYVKDLKREEGFTIDDFKRTIYGRSVCAPCGVIKRHVFDELAERAGVKILATGHNLDDIVGTMLTTFFAGDLGQLVRLKPTLKPAAPHQPRKVKPLIKCTELEDLHYACLLYTSPSPRD